MPCLSQRTLDGRAQLAGQLVDGGGEEGQLWAACPRGAGSPDSFKKALDGDVDELVGAGVAVAVEDHLLEEAFVDGLLQAVGVDDFGQHLTPDVGRAGVVVAGHHAGAGRVQAGGEDVDGGAQAGVGLLRADAHVLGQRLAEGVVGLVHVDAQLLQAAQLLEALVGGQFAFLFRLVEVVEVGGVGVDAVGSKRVRRSRRTAGRRRSFPCAGA